MYHGISQTATLRVCDWLKGSSYTGLLKVKVTTAYYGLSGEHWCDVTRVASGDTPYPIKVDIPNRGNGQYRYDEVLDGRLMGVLMVGDLTNIPDWILEMMNSENMVTQ